VGQERVLRKNSQLLPIHGSKLCQELRVSLRRKHNSRRNLGNNRIFARRHYHFYGIINATLNCTPNWYNYNNSHLVTCSIHCDNGMRKHTRQLQRVGHTWRMPT